MFFLNEAYVALVEAEQWAYGAIKRLETIQKDKIHPNSKRIKLLLID